MNHLFVVLAALLVVVLGGIALVSRSRMVARRATQWEHLVARLAVLDRAAIARIALQPDTDESRAEDRFGDAECELWFQEAGWKGLEDLKQNCAVMIDMAHYLQSTYPEALVMAEQLRITARQVNWYIDRLRLASEAGHLKACFAEYAAQAIGLYYGMTETVKSVYRELGVPGHEQLEAVL